MSRSIGFDASLQGLGRLARCHPSRSAPAARYFLRPPLPATSLLTVDGSRPRRAAITRNDRPAARPREISSRSSTLKRTAARRRPAGSRGGNAWPADGIAKVVTERAQPEPHPHDLVKLAPSSTRAEST